VVQAVDVVEVLLLLEMVMMGVVVSVMVVVRIEYCRRTATGRDQASGATAEFRSQYVIYAELQRTFGRTVQTATGSGLYSVVVVFGSRTVVATRLADRLVAPAPAVPAVQFHRLHGHRLCAHALLQTVGHHHHVQRVCNAVRLDVHLFPLVRLCVCSLT